MTSTCGPSIFVEAVNMVGRAVRIQFKVMRDRVEVFESSVRTGAQRNLAMIDRDQLVRWLSEPDEPLIQDDLTLEIDYALDRRNGRLAITTKSVLLWSLSPREEAAINRHLVPR
jgi:hypothetical protein